MIANGLAIRSSILSLEAELVRSRVNMDSRPLFTWFIRGAATPPALSPCCTALFSSDAFPVNSDR